MKEQFGMIYKIENKINGKVYIGQTTRSVVGRYGKKLQRVRNKPLREDIDRYGYENFEVTENIEFGENFEELNLLEKKYIEIYDSTNPEKGYNTEPGGGNHPMTEEVKRKIGNSVKGERNGNWGKRGQLSPNFSQTKLNCDCCGKEIWVIRAKMLRSKHHYCSTECKKKDASHIRVKTEPKKVDVVCAQCGTIYRRYPSQIAGRKNLFCSRECKNEFDKEANKGKNNPNYGNHKVAGGGNGRAIKVKCLDTGEVFDCARDADRKYGFRIGSVSSVCRGEQKTTHGLRFQYCDD